MKIVSWNVNGLRAIYKRGLFGWLGETGADILCLQETKAQEEQLTIGLFEPRDYYLYLNSAQRKGYSGVAVYSKRQALVAKRKLGLRKFDNEGRVLELEYPDFILINLYMPHGGRQKEHLEYKLEAYGCLFKKLEKLKNKKVILVGDFNIAHKEIDLARPKQNRHNIMFTPEERKQIDKLISFGLTDSFRKFHKGGGNYTWWPYFARARQRNLGWRIDYAFTSQSLTPELKNTFILPEVEGSDHCPIGIEI